VLTSIATNTNTTALITHRSGWRSGTASIESVLGPAVDSSDGAATGIPFGSLSSWRH